MVIKMNNEYPIKSTEEKNLYNELFNSSPDPNVVVDITGIIKIVNIQTEKLFGYYKEELIGSSINILMPELNKNKFQSYIDSYIRKPIFRPMGSEMELSGLRKDGHKFPAEISLSPLKVDGDLLVSSTIRDITDRKKLEEKLKTSNEYLERKVQAGTKELDRVNTDLKKAFEKIEGAQINLANFFSLSLDLLCIANSDGYFIHLNPLWKKTLGWSLDELAAKPYLEFVHPDDRESTINEMQKLTHGKDIINYENRYIAKDGNYYRISWRATRSQKSELIFAVANKITKIIESQSILEYNEKKLTTVLNFIEEGITFSDEKGIFEIYNPEMKKITGYSMEEANTGDFSKLLYPIDNDRQKALDGLKKIVETKKSHSTETTIVTKEGTQKHLVVSTKRIDFMGKEMFLSTYRDITKQKKMETEL